MWSATATATTAAALHAASASAGTWVANRPNRPSAAMAASRGQETRRQMAALKAACPARNSAGPPRISQATQADACPVPPCSGRHASDGDVGCRGDDDAAHHDRVDEVIGGPPEPARIG